VGDFGCGGACAKPEGWGGGWGGSKGGGGYTAGQAMRYGRLSRGGRASSGWGGARGGGPGARGGSEADTEGYGRVRECGVGSPVRGWLARGAACGGGPETPTCVPGAERGDSGRALEVLEGGATRNGAGLQPRGGGGVAAGWPSARGRSSAVVGCAREPGRDKPAGGGRASGDDRLTLRGEGCGGRRGGGPGDAGLGPCLEGRGLGPRGKGSGKDGGERSGRGFSKDGEVGGEKGCWTRKGEWGRWCKGWQGAWVR